MKKLLLALLLLFPSSAWAQITAGLGWHDLTSTTIRAVCPNPSIFSVQGAENCATVTDAWSGGVLDTQRNRLIMLGGGHNAYPGNELYALNLGDGTANPTLTRITNPSTVIRDGCTNGGTYADGRPVARHTYDQLAYLPDTDEMFMYGGSMWQCGGMGGDTWIYNFAANTWTQMTNTNAPSANFSRACAYDQKNKLVYCHDNLVLKSFNRTANTWTTRSVAGSSVAEYKTAIIDPVRKRYIMTSNDNVDQLYWYDISAASGTSTRQIVSSNCSFVGDGRMGWAYDPVQDKIVVWVDGNSVEIMDPVTFQCTTQTFANGPAQVRNQFDLSLRGTYGRFRYSPRLNVFVTCNDVDLNCTALRLTQVKNIMPTVDDEKNTYRAWGWNFSGATDTFNTVDPITLTVSNPDIHGTTEGDDGWQYHMQFRRSSNVIFQTRATAWLNYFKSGYRACTGSGTQTFCYDRDNFGLDHWYGTGLIDYYEASGDAAALSEINNLGNFLVNTLYNVGTTPYNCVPASGCLQYGQRLLARQLLFVTRWAEVTGNAAAVTLRDQIIALFLGSAYWDAKNGMYWVGDTQTDGDIGAGSYAAGYRITASFYPGLIAEAFHQAYRTTGNATLKTRLVAIAAFVKRCGLDATFQYVGSRFGINTSNDTCFQNHFSPPTGFADPALSVSLVNVLVYGYKYTGDATYLAAAKTAYNRGTKGVFGSSSSRSCADTTVCNFMDTTFDNSNGNAYLDLNKGAIQYAYRLFENGGFPTVIGTGDTTPPTIVITSPTAAPTLAMTGIPSTTTIAVSGTAADDTSLAFVTWVNNRGGSGTATGLTSWSIPSVTILQGTNVITVTAQDGAGNTGIDILTVTYNALTATSLKIQ